jgi:PAT family beta-lactamase induction signal transducer AmpG
MGRLFATSAVVAVAGALKSGGQDPKTAWTMAIGLSAAVMGALGIYHYFMLPVGSISHRPRGAEEIFGTFFDELKAFFQKKAIWGMLIFVFLYRSGEGFLLQEAPLFVQAKLSDGGLGLTLTHKAIVDGTVSNIVGFGAGILSGLFIARFTLKRTLLVLALCMNIPHICYIYLSHVQSPDQQLPFWVILLLVSIEKFGYSFGFTGNMLYMMQQIAPGKYKMTHYAFATSLMNLVLIPTQAFSGKFADWMGYRHYFIFVLIASIPSVIAAWKAPFPDPPDEDGEDETVQAPKAGILATEGAAS